MSQYSSPAIWGPHFWFILRCIAHNYPINPSSEDANHIKIFFTKLQHVLPCEICKYTFRQHLNKHPIEQGLAGRTKLIDWVETIYQETKKVIQDKRVKILDIFEDERDEIEPVRIIYKSRPNPMEEQLTKVRNAVINKETKAIPIPKEPATPKQSKTYQIDNKNNRHFGVAKQEKKMHPIQMISQPKALPPPPQPPKSKMIPKNILGINNIRDRAINQQVPNVTGQSIKKMPNIRTPQPKIGVRELVLTKKCKKCE